MTSQHAILNLPRAFAAFTRAAFSSFFIRHPLT